MSDRGIKLRKVAFFGDAALGEDTKVYQDAFAAARILAKKGYTIVNGGGPGVMVASTNGAESVGGKTISVTFYPQHATGFEGRYLSNVTDKEIKTSNYIDRMFGLMAESDIFLMFQGGTGTISELGTAWVLAKLYYGHHKPFILVGAFWRPIIDAFAQNMLIDAKEMDVFRIVDTIEEIEPMIVKMEKKINQIPHDHCKHCSESVFMN